MLSHTRLTGAIGQCSSSNSSLLAAQPNSRETRSRQRAHGAHGRPFEAGPALRPQSDSVCKTRRHSITCASLANPRVYFFGRSDPELTVAKLQVGIFGRVEELQRALDRIAGLLETDLEDSMRELVQDVAILLARNKEYVAYAHTAIALVDDLDEAEAKFNNTSIKERSKFKKETLMNFGGRQEKGRLQETGKDVGLDRWLCVTLLLAVDMPFKLPKVRSIADLQKALQMIGGLGAEDIIAAELLWTPQEEGDAYSRDELLEDYPTLVTL